MQANSRFGRRQARSTPDILTSLMPALESFLMMLQGFSICIKISADWLIPSDRGPSWPLTGVPKKPAQTIHL
jgi:hypothetical protein